MNEHNSIFDTMKRKLLFGVLSALMLLFVPANVRAIEVVDGVYQIGSAADFAEFGKIVSTGQNKISGVLTADIDFTDVAWTPVGDATVAYAGKFDGQEHRISNLVINSTSSYLGLFGAVADGASISNLIIDSSCSISGASYCGGVVGGSVGSGTATLKNLGNEADITVTSKHAGGIVGSSVGGTMSYVLINCYNSGDIIGPKECAAICGSMPATSTISGCYNTGSIVGYEEGKKLWRGSLNATQSNLYDIEGVQGDSISLEMVKSGQVAYLLRLNAVEESTWGQNLDNGQTADAHPYPFASHAIVYSVGTLNCDGTPSADVSGYSNTNSSVQTPHNYVSGVCSVCQAVQEGYVPTVDGVYQISDASQLYWFARTVNTGTNTINAVLTADIDYSEYHTLDAMIGTDTYYFNGTFDGQQHTITLGLTEPNDTRVALFRYINDATIRNLIVDGTIETAYRVCGGIFAGAKGTTLVENCISAVELTSGYEANLTTGGIGSYAYGNFTMRNCAFTGKFTTPTATSMSGLIGVAQAKSTTLLQNCYVNADLTEAGSGKALINTIGKNASVTCTNLFYTNTGTLSGQTNRGTQVEEDDLYSGALCYKLNSLRSDSVSWYQNLDSEGELDDAPVPFSNHSIVYVVGTINCDGSIGESTGYSNTESSVTLPHNYADGVCSVCGDVQTNYLSPVDGYYEIASAAELNWFAKFVNKGNTEVNARLTSDIDFSEQSAGGVSIGDYSGKYQFAGTFDGQGHTVTLAYNNPEGQRNALFIYVNNGTIRNLHTTGTIASGYGGAGIAFVAQGNSLVENCISSVDFTATLEGDATMGGLVSVATNHTKVRNCGFVGSMNLPGATGNSAIVGYSSGGVQVVIENCYVAATSIITAGNGAVIVRNNGTVANCYYIDPGDLTINPYTTEITEDQLTSGELCFLLNGKVSGGELWTQEIGTDRYPVPFGSGAKVYANGTLSCDGATDAMQFTNTEGDYTIADHQYNADGVCELCGARKISTAAQLASLASDISSGFANANISVILESDIDMQGITDYEGIGSQECPFQGIFDGQGHVISNLTVNSTSDFKGLFGAVSGGAVIKNVTLDSSCSISGANYVAGIAGGSTGYGLVTIENCGNEAQVYASVRNSAGILGSNVGGTALFRITNCYNAGNLTGPKENGAISGYLHNAAELTNCYNSGTVENFQSGRTFVRYGSTIFLENCYDVLGTQVTMVTDEQVKSGELCYLLNGSVSGGDIFFQTLASDSHPVLTESHSKVYEQNGKYYNDVVGIKKIDTAAKGDGIQRIFTTDGVRVSKLQKGVNIVRKADGTTQKVLVK